MTPADTPAACVMRHRKPTRAITGLHLCPGHVDWIADTLTDMPAAWALLDHVALPGPGDGTRPGRRIDAPTPVRLDVVALRDHRTKLPIDAGDPYPVLAALHSWTLVVREERELTDPEGEATLSGVVLFLRAHLPWIAAQPWVDVFAGEVRRAGQALRDALGEHAPRPVGRCPVLMDDGLDCDGPLMQDRYGFWRVTCARCGEVWQEDELRRLGLVMGG